MRFNRTTREEKRDRQLATLGILGSIALVVIIVVFGVNILTAFSLLVDRIRGESKDTDIITAELLPPTLFPIAEATRSANLKVTGRATPGNAVIIYVNEEELERADIGDDGEFSEPIAKALKEGDNTIAAKQLDSKGKTSELSNIVRVTIKTKPPLLEITNPEDGASITSDNNNLEITGKTDEDVRVTINDRIALVRPDGNFSYNVKMSEGENTYTIIATDRAGNATTEKRMVRYQK